MRFASLNSPDSRVRARLQAALFSNRKRNKARREAQENPAPEWGTGILVVGEDTENGGFGYNGYADPVVGEITSPNSSFPIIYFETIGEDSLSIDILGDVTGILNSWYLNIGSSSIAIDGEFSLSFDETSSTATIVIGSSIVDLFVLEAELEFSFTETPEF